MTPDYYRRQLNKRNRKSVKLANQTYRKNLKKKAFEKFKFLKKEIYARYLKFIREKELEDTKKLREYFLDFLRY